MKTSIKIIAFLLTAVMLLSAASCGNDSANEPPRSFDLSKDREGNSVTLPETTEKIISFGAANTEILAALGFGDKIIAADTYSQGIPHVKSGAEYFDMYAPDTEKILDLQPDIMFITGMAKSDGIEKYGILHDTGICIIYIPVSSSIEGIKDDIRYIAAVMGAVSKGEEIVKDMEKEIDTVKKIGDGITDKKTVYFEIDIWAPSLYTFGKGVFLNEMLELIGAENIFAGQESWLAVSDEAVLDANPDVILTNIFYIEDAVGEIKARDGWETVTAVQNDAVYYIDADSSSRPTHNIVKALKDMAKAVYPDKFF
jgi:iron complex transport system substrate-binding protein